MSKNILNEINVPGILKPDAAIFDLPEKVLQFGTGVLLRGLCDYFVDKANRQGVFNGRIVVVKSTDSGGADSFDRQDGLYTLCVRGIEEGRKVEENIVCSAISRVLSAKAQWDEILRCAHNPEMKIVISNTTEVGIRLVEDNIRFRPPVSFPGKLLAFLYERYQAFSGSPESGMVIIPTELIPDNGRQLAAIVKELAAMNKLEANFITWLESYCHFCSSLVDRIVPGKPAGPVLEQLEKELGYSDDLLAISEVYRLWAIEGGDEVRKVLSFAAADEGVVIRPDIDVFRELKLRLLNGTHTLSCGLAWLAGFQTVKNAMDDGAFAGFVSDLMLHEIAPAIPYDLPLQEARDFGVKVLDRFRNPHIQHQWISITMQYSSKMRMRNIPVLLQHYKQRSTPPALFALGFAAYLLFMKGEGHPVNDDKAPVFAGLWRELEPPVLTATVLRDETLWGTDLSTLPGFEEAVLSNLEALIEKGAAATLAGVRVKA